MPEDLKQKEEEKKEEEGKKENEPSWFQKVPAMFKLIALVFLLIQYQKIVSGGGNIKEMWTWVAVTLIALYFLGTEGKRREPDILTPEDAELALKNEITRKIKDGQIDRWAKVFIGPNNGLFFYEGMPRHYQIGVEISTDGRKEYKRGIVNAEGNTKGYATLQDHPGKVTGRELIPIKTPKVFTDFKKKFGIDYDKLLFGGRYVP